MREIIARIVSALTVIVVLALSQLFASAHNQRDASELETPAPTSAPAGVQGGSEPAAAVTLMAPAPTPPVAAAATDDIARGRAVYEKQNCATCHSIAGEGNPRYPLDGVGANWDAGELEQWVTGSGVAAEVLSPGIAKRKQRYLKIPKPEMEALITYLTSLKNSP